MFKKLLEKLTQKSTYVGLIGAVVCCLKFILEACGINLSDEVYASIQQAILGVISAILIYTNTDKTSE